MEVAQPRATSKRYVGLLTSTVISTTALPLLLFPTPAYAAGGLAGVVNTYQRVQAVSGTAVSVTGASTGATAPFRPGDRVLVIQMTGGNPATGGALGSYETATLAAVGATTFTLSAALTHAYTPATDQVQLVRMVTDPGRTTLAATVAALPWNGSTGGVVAMGGGTLDLDGRSVDVVGDGFSTADGASGRSLSGNRVQAGTATGRGADGTSFGNGGGGGGGLGGGGGKGGNGSANAGGSTGAGASPDGRTAYGTNGGVGAQGALGRSSAGGSGGGGGVIGGGGGGGGGDLAVPGSGGGGGVTGGGGGGHGSLIGVLRAGAGGGGVGSSGNGGDGLSGGLLTSYGSAGGGGGSYGGGGASGGMPGPTSTGAGGGGGGSWTGGGDGGFGNKLQSGSRGGAGNAPVSAALPDSAHYLNTTNPRLIMGGAGGRGSADSGPVAGGNGGGIVVLDFATIVGAGSVTADGADGVAPTSGIHSGSGGGAGGQVKITGTTSDLTVTANGGSGGKPSAAFLRGAGAGGGGGGAGGIWLERPGAAQVCGGTPSISGATTSVAGGTAPRINNNGTVGGGAGGTGLVCSSPVTTYALGSRVWRDADADGRQTPGEPGLAGVPVSLVDAAGATAASTVTSASGRYVFDGLRAGTYRVHFGVPALCTRTVQGTSGTAVPDDSDADPVSGTTAAVPLGDGAPGLRPVEASDGATLATQINPTVDAGLVCSSTSTTTLGAFTQAPLTDLMPNSDGPFDGARGTVVMSATPESSSFILQVDGIAAGASGETFGAHLHFGPCVAGDSGAAGAHYNTDVLDGVFPPETSPRTEVWLDLTPDAGGYASATTTVPFVPSAAERSIVIHAQPTNPDTGTAGPRQACLPILIR